MPGAREIRRRIRVVKNIEQITNAMKMVAAARLRKAQERVEAARPYAAQMQLMMQNLAAAGAEVAHPLLEAREGGRLGLVVFTSDRGLCGSYNVNIMRRATELIGNTPPEDVRLVVLGRKGQAFFKRRPYPIAASFDMSSTDVSFADVRRISGVVRRLFEGAEVDRVDLVFARFFSAMTQRPSALQLLPVAPPEGAEIAETPYIFEPSPDVLLSSILPRYVDTQIYRAMVEAVASEHGARMTSMSNATNNAGDMIRDLTLELNRARQAGITSELAEIMGGVEALKG